MSQTDLQAIWLQAVAHFDREELQQAEALCIQLVEQAPDLPLAYTMLSRICHAVGLTRGATFNAFQASQRCAGQTGGDILVVASTLLEVNEHQLAHAVLGYIDAAHPANADVLLDMGRLYSVLEDQENALRCIQAARKAGREGPFIAHMESIVLSFLGKIDESIARCEESVAREPGYGHAHWSCAQYGRKDDAHARIDRMREVLRTPDIDADNAAYLQYGLFKEHDTLGETDAAWTALMAGAKARRSVTEHDAAQETAAYDALIEATSHGYLDACADVPRTSTPIFVVGMPRTGTTLLERILGNHPQIKTCGELNDFRQQMQWANDERLSLTVDPGIGEFVKRLDAHIVGNRYLIKTAWAAENNAFYVDKHPMNFQWCGAILKAIPHAKILHLRRHPLDSCFSNLKELFAHKYYPYSYALDELATHYRNYARLMRHWHAIAPGRILDVRYEDLASQPDVQARRVQAYLGLAEVEGVTDIVANKKVTTTASSLQVRQPIHTRNVGGWRRYAQGMAPVQALLADLVAEYEGVDASIVDVAAA
ncbi:MAG: sulfotransferase [Lysobacter sp.]|nr:sulfotransferase [Lysobacter sp.]